MLYIVFPLQGVGKVGPLMKWAQQHASIPFELPSMPHLNEEQVVLYKEQVREREEALEKKRKEDARAMAAEDRAQKEMKRKKRIAMKAAADSADSSERETANSETAGAITTEEELTEEELREEEDEEDFVDRPISKIAKRKEERLKLEAQRRVFGEGSDEDQIASTMRRKRGSNVYASSQDDEL
jgi:hypothetical protein